MKYKWTKVVKSMVNQAFLDPDLYEVVVISGGRVEVWYKEAKKYTIIHTNLGVITMGATLRFWAMMNGFPIFDIDEYSDIWIKHNHIWR